MQSVYCNVVNKNRPLVTRQPLDMQKAFPSSQEAPTSGTHRRQVRKPRLAGYSLHDAVSYAEV